MRTKRKIQRFLIWLYYIFIESKEDRKYNRFIRRYYILIEKNKLDHVYDHSDMD